MNWTGPYVGAQLGYSLSDVGFVYRADDYVYSLPEKSLSQGLLGFRAGYDWQVRHFVIGIVADADRRFGTDSLYENSMPAIPYDWEIASDWDVGLRVKTGVLAQDNLLFYATGGLAAANYNLTNETCSNCAAWYDHYPLSGTYYGWSAGLGVEYKFNQKWSAQVEYLHSEFGNPTDYWEDRVQSSEPNLSSSSVKTGLNFRF